MLFHDRPFVPPGCPQNQASLVPDLNEMPFTFYAHNCSIDSSGNHTATEIISYFGLPNESDYDYDPLIEVEAADVPIQSDIARMALAFLGGDSPVSNKESAHAEKMRKLFVERVANCQGLREGNCWALGRGVMEQAIQVVFDGQDLPDPQ